MNEEASSLFFFSHGGISANEECSLQSCNVSYGSQNRIIVSITMYVRVLLLADETIVCDLLDPINQFIPAAKLF